MLLAEVQSILDGTGWMGAVRDDNAVAAEIASGRDMEDVFMLEGAAVFDEFFHFLTQNGLMKHVETLANRLPCVRENVPAIRYVLLYLIKLLMGIPGMAQMGPLLLQDPAMMQLVGFNAFQIENGVTRRGDALRAEGTEREGPVTSETIADNLVKLNPVALEAFFNDVIRDLIPRYIRTSRVHAVLDTSDYETTENYEGCGKARRERKVSVKDSSRATPKVEVTVCGWKIGVLYHTTTQLPLALKIECIDVSDHHFTSPLVDQAVRNLGDKKLVLLSMDRGFLDGKVMWELKHSRSIDFIIPARADMLVYDDACSQVHRWEKERQENPKAWRPDKIFPDQRSEVKPVKGEEGRPTTRVDRTVVIGVEGLTTLETYGTAAHYGQRNSKQFQANPLNAVVVTHYHGEKVSRPVVYLTSLSTRKPFQTYDRYDDRSLIENNVFREQKQDWLLQRPPKKTEAGVIVHVYLALVAMALVRYFRFATAEVPPEPSTDAPLADPPPVKAFQLGMQRYREGLKVKNRNKVIVFIDDLYGIFHVQEMVILSGGRLRAGPSRWAPVSRYSAVTAWSRHRPRAPEQCPDGLPNKRQRRG